MSTRKISVKIGYTEYVFEYSDQAVEFFNLLRDAKVVSHIYPANEQGHPDYIKEPTVKFDPVKDVTMQYRDVPTSVVNDDNTPF